MIISGTPNTWVLQIMFKLLWNLVYINYNDLFLIIQITCMKYLFIFLAHMMAANILYYHNMNHVSGKKNIRRQWKVMFIVSCNVGVNCMWSGIAVLTKKHSHNKKIVVDRKVNPQEIDIRIVKVFVLTSLPILQCFNNKSNVKVIIEIQYSYSNSSNGIHLNFLCFAQYIN